MIIVGATVLGGLWTLEWVWHIRVTNLRGVFIQVGLANFFGSINSY